MREPADLLSRLPETPAPPYWAVVFTSIRTRADEPGYAATAQRLDELLRAQPGFLGLETARGPDGLGITVGYFESREAIAAWGAHAEHRAAQERGRETWYRGYALRICRVEEARSFTA
jgi:heme-degrading monooxygenase HmoA